MNKDKYTTPRNPSSSSRIASLRSTGTKRDSLQAELEKDPHLSTAKRQQRTQAFSSSMAHASLERQLLAAQTAKLELENKLRDRDIQVERLEGDRRWLADREQEEREEKERDRQEWEEQKGKTEAELRELRTALTSLREEHASLQDEHSRVSLRNQQTIATQRADLITLNSQLSHLQATVAELDSLASSRGATIVNLQNELEELSAAQANTSRVSRGEQDWDVLREELSRQATYTSKLESTNVKLKRELAALKDRQTSVEVLKEEKRSLEKKVQGVEKLRERVVKLEGELAAAQKERQEWATRATQLDEPSQVPVSLTQSLSVLRLDHARLLEEHGANVALLRKRDAEIAALQDQESESRETIETLQQEQRKLKDKISRLEYNAKLAEREVGFLKSLNASYVAEEAANAAGQVDKAKDEQIKNLTGLIDEYRKRLDAMEKALESRPAPSKPTPRSEELKALLEAQKEAAQELEEAIKERDATIEKHETQIDNLEQTLFELRGEIGAGRHIPPGVRILSMKQNPAQEWADSRKEILERLKSENEALIKRLKELEEAGVKTEGQQNPNGEDLVPRESWEVINKEKEELQQELQAKEKRMLRLQQVYRAKAEEFKEVVSSIMGIKLAFYPNGQVRVTSLYDLNASFMFKPSKAPINPIKASINTHGPGNSDGSMSMTLVAQGEGGPEDLMQLMRNWIEEEGSIPGFMASVTLDCFERWKLAGGQAQI